MEAGRRERGTVGGRDGKRERGKEGKRERGKEGNLLASIFLPAVRVDHACIDHQSVFSMKLVVFDTLFSTKHNLSSC